VNGASYANAHYAQRSVWWRGRRTGGVVGGLPGQNASMMAPTLLERFS
jgi:hypothetical protein